MSVAERLTEVRKRIAMACAACDRDPGEVTLIAVSKRHPAAAIRDALAAGQHAFGENRIQELVAKAGELDDAPVRWHMIGSVQTNKVRELVGVAGLELVHSLDRLKLAERLQAALDTRGADLDVLVQVNASGEGEKHGAPPEDVVELAEQVRRGCPRLRIRGVMAMGPRAGDPAPAFALAGELRERLRDRLGEPLEVLSLGMSGDLEAAIAAGSTMVRVGTAVFGPRSR